MHFMEREKDRNSNPPPGGSPRQQQSDPQITELRGFTKEEEDLEPTLADGTKAPDKAEEENRAQGGRVDE
jgi:hypothetical protein